MLDSIVCKHRDLRRLEMKAALNKKNVGDSKPPRLDENYKIKLLIPLEKY